MTLLTCPFCGPRELEEFQFRSTLPSARSSAVAEVFERTSHLDRSVEHWQHVGGCRSWLLLERNPSTGEIRRCISLAQASHDPTT